jgi:hypothetical protein
MAAAFLAGLSAASMRFRPDDPLQRDPDTVADAGGVSSQELSQYFDFLSHTFRQLGDRTVRAAMNVNTMDEVPDSMWFVDRIGRGTMTKEEVVRGPDQAASLAVRDWVIIGAKNSGLQPGFRAVAADDASRQLFQIEFDPPDYPELATGAEVIGTALYHALGYFVVENYIIELDASRITIAPTARIRDAAGRNRQFTRDDLDAVLRRAARRPDGSYRALASRFAPGEPRGSFRYFGTRPDDPNDIYPHEHRRELRAARVFGAWVAHDDSRGNNSLDMLEGEPGARYLRHYMFDFGSIMGSATTGPNPARSGHEYLVEGSAILRTLATFGLMPPAWARVNRPYAPAAGPFFGDAFDPVAWKPEYPNPAFENMQPSDAFWAARRVAAFTDEYLAAIVAKARYSDPAATRQIIEALAQRRDAIARAWLPAVTPVVNPALDAAGRFTFRNAAVDAGVAAPGTRYEVQWSRFDNVTGRHEDVRESQSLGEPGGQAPLDLLAGSEYIAVAVRVVHPDHSHWVSPVTIYFRRSASAWTPVGLYREGDRRSPLDE